MNLNPFKRTYTSKELEIFNFLSKSKVFEELTEDEMVHFIPYMFLREYNQNEVVYFRGDPSQALYIINSGIVGLNLDIEDKIEKLGFRRQYQLLGEEAVSNGNVRNINAVVFSEKAELYVIPTEYLSELFAKKPAIQAKICQEICVAYNQFISDLFKVYRKNHGFFEMNQVFNSRR
jgi:CRP-like cAMP-binding protein